MPSFGEKTVVHSDTGTSLIALTFSVIFADHAIESRRFPGANLSRRVNRYVMRNSGNAQQIEVGWWPGDPRYPQSAFFAFAFPAPDGFEKATLRPPAAHWNAELGEYILNWEEVRVAPDPRAAVLDFGLSAIRHACTVCGWDPDLAASAEGVPAPVV